MSYYKATRVELLNLKLAKSPIELVTKAVYPAGITMYHNVPQYQPLLDVLLGDHRFTLRQRFETI